jgi:hypothetical protein
MTLSYESETDIAKVRNDSSILHLGAAHAIKASLKIFGWNLKGSFQARIYYSGTIWSELLTPPPLSNTNQAPVYRQPASLQWFGSTCKSVLLARNCDHLLTHISQPSHSVIAGQFGPRPSFKLTTA